jgi:UDP-N-acetylglucosamine 3-dehydrogenase
MKIKIGLIGAGNISSLHASGFKNHPNAEIVAICDKRRKIAQKRAIQWGIKRIYQDYYQLLNQKDIDAVAILTPHYLHAPITIAAAETGKHILVEKPMAMSLNEADQMINATKKAGVSLMVAENQVFHPPHVVAKRLIEQDEIGLPVMIRMNLGWATGRIPDNSADFLRALAAFEERNLKQNKDWETGDMWRLDPNKRGGGSLIDEGHHRLSVADYLLGHFENIYAFIDELHFEQYKFSWEYGGIFGWKYNQKRCYGVLCTHLGAPEFIKSEGGSIFDDRIEIIGSKGYLWIRGCEGKIMDSPPLQLLNKFELKSITNIQSDYAAGFNEMTHHFVDSILNDTIPRFTGEDGKRILNIILSAYTSAKEKKLIPLT